MLGMITVKVVLIFTLITLKFVVVVFIDFLKRSVYFEYNNISLSGVSLLIVL